MTVPQQGEKAPAFKLPRDGGATVALADFKGRQLVLYFYPKADTDACTREAQDFTRLRRDFDAAGAVVIGVSRDPVKALDRFQAKYDLGVQLATDESLKVLEAYGVWGEKSMYGRSYLGIARTTFLIDGKGRIARVWEKVKVKDHAEEVLAAAKAL